MSISQYRLATAERERLLAEPDPVRLMAGKAALDRTVAAEVKALRSIVSRPLGNLADVAAAAGILRDLIAGADWEDYHAPLAGRVAEALATLASGGSREQDMR